MFEENIEICGLAFFAGKAWKNNKKLLTPGYTIETRNVWSNLLRNIEIYGQTFIVVTAI